MYKNPRYADSENRAVLVDYVSGTSGCSRYIDSDPELAEVVGGQYGQVAPYSEPVVPLSELAEAKLNRINEGKNAHLDSGFLHDGVFFDSDLKARAAYLELDTELRGDPGYTTGWKASSGVWVQMDKALYDALRVSYKAHVSACFAWQAAREQEVADAMALENEAEARAALEAVSEVM